VTKRPLRTSAPPCAPDLLRLARERGEELPNPVFTRYANERLLFRLASSKTRVPLRAEGRWQLVHRLDRQATIGPTRDLDLPRVR